MRYLALGLLVGGVWLMQCGLIYQTGAQWYDSCWRSTRGGLSDKPSPATPAEAKAWSACEAQADQAFHDAGLVWTKRLFLADPVDHLPFAGILKACPSIWRDQPMGGMHYKLVSLLEERGGHDLLDRFLPAEQMLVRIYEERWPDCNRAREAAKVPRMRKMHNEWDFVEPCHVAR